MLLIGGPMLIAICLRGSTAHQLFFEACGAIAVGCIVRGARRYRPEHSEIWYGLGASLAIFIVSFGIRLAFPDAMASVPSGAPRLADYIDMVGLTVVVATIFQQSRVRDDTDDPTTLMDSTILTGGISALIWTVQVYPALASHSLALSGRLIAAYMGIQLTWLTFCGVRLALTFRTRNQATLRLTLAIVLAVVAGLCAVNTKTTNGNWMTFFAAIALLLLGSAALHKSMTELTAPGNHDRRWIPTGRMNPIRALVTTPALLIAPIALLCEIVLNRATPLNATYLTLCWATVTGFVLLRLINLMTLRERSTEADHIVMAAASSLVASSGILETCSIVTTAMIDLLPTRANPIAILIIAENDVWTVAEARGDKSSAIKGKILPASLVDRLLTGNADADHELAHVLGLDRPETPIVLSVPLTSQRTTRGALLLLTAEPASVIAYDAVRSLATNVTLSIEAIALSERLHAQRSDHRFRTLVEQSPDMIMVIDKNNQISFLSPAAERQLEPGNRDLGALLDVIHPDDRPSFSDLIERARGHDRREQIDRRAFRMGTDADTRWFDATIRNLFDDPTVNGVVINARDISERKSLEENLQHQVLHDDLTGIPNRVLFRARLDEALSSPSHQNQLVAALFVDLDDFKTINDLLGHDAGDQLLKVVAFRLERSIRTFDVASRFGGDEFAVLLSGLEDVEAVLAAATRVLEAVTEPLEFGERNISVSASIGIAIADTSITSDVLLRNADVAMYHAKQTGKNRFKLFDDAMLLGAFERLEMKVEISHALERGELSLDYQPIVRLEDSALIGFETLLRWVHPTLGLVPPGSFIPLAEQNGAIVEMGRWVLAESCNQLAVWLDLYKHDLFMSVNLSPLQLDNDAVIDHVQSAIRDSGIQAQQLILELTESTGLEDPHSRQRLVSLRELGCGIAADDFGTGFASYAALQQLPFSTVKIDSSLTAGLSHEDQRAGVQMQSIIEMAHGLGMHITVEGVETMVQLEKLRSLGANAGQGYLIGIPLPPAKAERMHLERFATQH